MELFEQAQDEVGRALADVDNWDTPSTCPGWTVRDVAGHLIWGQLQLAAWATGGADPAPSGAPGTPNPGVMTGDDPVAAWKSARAAADEVLTEETAAKLITIPAFGEVPIAGMMALLVCDLTTHVWDIEHALGKPVRLPAPLVAASHEWALAHLRRAPGFFGPELTPPADADAQTRMLAFLGRAA